MCCVILDIVDLHLAFDRSRGDAHEYERAVFVCTDARILEGGKGKDGGGMGERKEMGWERG